MNLDYLLRYQLVGKAGLRLQRRQAERKAARAKPHPDRALNPPLRSTIEMREMMSRHYL